MIRECVAYVTISLADRPEEAERVARWLARQVGGTPIDWEVVPRSPRTLARRRGCLVLARVDLEEEP